MSNVRQSRYRVVVGKDIDKLDKKVNALLVQGFIVSGGVTFSDGFLYQVVVKPEDGKQLNG